MGNTLVKAKRVIAFFLAVMLVATALPQTARTVKADEITEKSEMSLQNLSEDTEEYPEVSELPSDTEQEEQTELLEVEETSSDASEEILGNADIDTSKYDLFELEKEYQINAGEEPTYFVIENLEKGYYKFELIDYDNYKEIKYELFPKRQSVYDADDYWISIFDKNQYGFCITDRTLDEVGEGSPKTVDVVIRFDMDVDVTLKVVKNDIDYVAKYVSANKIYRDKIYERVDWTPNTIVWEEYNTTIRLEQSDGTIVRIPMDNVPQSMNYGYPRFFFVNDTGERPPEEVPLQAGSYRVFYSFLGESEAAHQMFLDDGNEVKVTFAPFSEVLNEADKKPLPVDGSVTLEKNRYFLGDEGYEFANGAHQFVRVKQLTAGQKYSFVINESVTYNGWDHDARIYNENGEMCVLDRMGIGKVYNFTPETTGDYILDVFCSCDASLSLELGNTITDIKIKTQPKTEYVYPSFVTNRDMVITVTSNNDPQTARDYSFEEDFFEIMDLGIREELYDAKTNEALHDIGDFCERPGEYYYRIYCDDCPELDLKSSIITVSDFGLAGKITIGQAARVKANCTGTDHWNDDFKVTGASRFEVDLKAGVPYCISGQYEYATLISAESYWVGELGFSNTEENYFGVDKDGKYYIDLYTFKDTSFTVTQLKRIKSFRLYDDSQKACRKVYIPPHRSLSGERINVGTVKLICTMEDGTEEEVNCTSSSDNYCKALGFDMEYCLPDKSTEYWGNIERVEGKTYYFKISNKFTESEDIYIPYEVVKPSVIKPGDVVDVPENRGDYGQEKIYGYLAEINIPTLQSDEYLSFELNLSIDNRSYATIIDENGEYAVSEYNYNNVCFVPKAGHKYYLAADTYTDDVVISYSVRKSITGQLQRYYVDGSGKEISITSNDFGVIKFDYPFTTYGLPGFIVKDSLGATMDISKCNYRVLSRYDHYFVYPDETGSVPPGDYYFRVAVPNYNFSTGKSEIIYLDYPVSIAGKAYYIECDANAPQNAKVSGFIRTQGAFVGTELELIANQYTCPGYEFVCWSTGKTNAFSADKTDEEIKKELSDLKYDVYDDRDVIVYNNECEVKLYAVWKAATYKINYHMNGAKLNTLTGITRTFTEKDAGKSVVLPKADEMTIGAGFRFEGWYTSPQYNPNEKVDSITIAAPFKDIDLYAKTVTEEMIIKFVPNGTADNAVSGTMSDMSVYLGAPNKIGKLGYSSKLAFVGWGIDGADNTIVVSPNQEFDLTGNDGAILKAADFVPGADGVKTVTLKAIWQKSFNITYNLHSELRPSAVATPSLPVGKTNPASYDYGTKVTLSPLELAGYTFNGWYTGYDPQNGYTGKVTAISKKDSGNLTLHAKFTPNIYTVKFDGNGGAGKVSPIKGLTYRQNPGYNIIPPQCEAYTKAGYRFIGFTTADYKNVAKAFSAGGLTDVNAIKNAIIAANPGMNIYSAGDCISEFSVKNGATVVLYAVWADRDYNLTLNTDDANWVNDSSLSEIITAGAKPDMNTANDLSFVYKFNNKSGLKLPEAGALSKDGYTFSGWYTGLQNSDGTVTYAKKVANTKSLSGDITLFAKWEADYTIKFIPGDNTTGAMNDAKMRYGKEKAIAGSKFKKKDFAFAGWALSAEDAAAGIVTYADKEKISTPLLTKTANGFELKLYAVWKDTFNITYMDGTAVTHDTYRLGTVKELIVPSNEGYKFDGWYTYSIMADGSVKYIKKISKITASTSGDLSLAAKWGHLTYKVNYDSNYPKASKHVSQKKSQKLTWGLYGQTLNNKAFKVKGYTLVGWSVNQYPVLEENSVMPSDAFVTGTRIHGPELGTFADANGKTDKTLYAVWKLQEYSITYSGIKAEYIDMDSLKTSYNVEENVALLEPSRLGCTFEGWYLDPAFKKKAGTKILAGTTGDKTFYAKWKVNK